MRFVWMVRVLTVLLIGVAAFICYHAEYWQVPEGKVIVIEKGTSTSNIVDNLYKEELISNRWVGLGISYSFGLAKKYLQPGEYKIEKGLKAYRVLAKIASGDRFLRLITIPEGLTIKQINEIIEKSYGLKGNITVLPPEGYLLPETYAYYYGDAKDSIINRMHRDMLVFLNSLPSLPDHKNLLNLASIVEKETQIDSERPLIASVFYNRLKLNMPLQADPTVIYGITNGYGTLNRAVTPADLKFYTPYNSYINRGLPPTPICNPGKASILAVINPAQTDYLYFVADGVGGHKFSNSYSAHIANIQALKRLQVAKNK
jgi:UPF0755 protein